MGHRRPAPSVLRRSLAPLAAGLLVLGTGCVSVGGTDHQAARSDFVPDVAACDRHGDRFERAVETLCIRQAGNEAFSPAERRLLEILAAIYRGDTRAAIAELEAFVEEGHTGRAQSFAVSALATLLYGDSRWTELVALAGNRGDEAVDPETTGQNAVLAAAFADLPPEKVTFSSEPARVKTRRNHFGQPVLEIRANGVRKKFLLDTGASATVLTRSTAREVGARILGEHSILGQTSTSRRVEAWPGVLDELRLGDELVIGNHPVAVVEDETLVVRLAGVPILSLDGIVGWPVFRELRVEIDYGGGETTIRRSRGPSRSPRNLFWLGYPMVVAAGTDGTPWFFGLDTGAAGTSLNTHILRKAGLRAVSGGQGIRLGAGGGEAVAKRDVHGVTLHLAGWQLSFPEMSITDGVKAAELVKPDGKLGSDVLRGARVVVDLRAGEFAIER